MIRETAIRISKVLAKTNNIEAVTTGTKNFCEKIGDSGEILLLVHDTVSDTAKEREAEIKNELAANHPNVTVTETIYLDQLEMLEETDCG